MLLLVICFLHILILVNYIHVIQFILGVTINLFYAAKLKIAYFQFLSTWWLAPPSQTSFQSVYWWACCILYDVESPDLELANKQV